MADAGVSFLLEKLEQILTYYVKLLADSKAEFENLQKDLRVFKAFLEDAALRRDKHNAFREIERQIRNDVYEVEDTIDSCLTAAIAAAAAKPSKGIKWMRSLKNAPKKVSLAEGVKSLRAKIKPNVDLLRERFDRGSSQSTKEQPETKVKRVQIVKQENIVGFKEEEESFINSLTKEKDTLEVFSIIGMPGLGKTTLTSKIYENPQIKYDFPIRIWVYVSEEYNIREVLLSIAKAFTTADMSNMSVNDIARTVHSFLKDEKFLLVLDDVWTTEAWEKIENVLPMNNGRSKVLITSRHRDVGKRACRPSEPHPLRFLTPKESWELLRLQVFGTRDGCPDKLLTETGQNIAKKCDGLPLAIVVIGGILVDKYSKERAMSENIEAWDEVSQNVSKYVKDNMKKNMSEVVALSYNNLPFELRDCFLYLGVFPEDHEIPVWTLTRLWIAEGFVQRKEGQSLEETAEKNLEDLINRNLVMVGKTNPNLKLKACRVHDVIRAFCISEASPKEQDLLQEIKKSEKGGFEPPFSQEQTYHRLCIHSHLSEFLSGQVKLVRGVRSFLCFNKGSFVLESKYNAIIPDTFTLLRVLDSNSFKFDKFPSRFTNLIHMRYLTLSLATNFDSLPKAVAELWNLQTLVIDTQSRKLTIKANIWKMFQLRHLKTNAEIILAIDEEVGNEASKNLVTLSKLSPEHCTEEVFKRACYLKKLGIRGRLAILLDDKHTFAKLVNIENLSLVNDLYYAAASDEPLPGLPPANCFPPNIKSLTLSATHLSWKHMSTLANIATLQVLKLKDNAFKGSSWTVGAIFHSLRFLLIATADLDSWKASDNQFPKLCCLVLRSCQNLNKIPLVSPGSLQTLDIDGVPETVVQSAKEIQRNKAHFKLCIGPECK